MYVSNYLSKQLKISLNGTGKLSYVSLKILTVHLFYLFFFPSVCYFLNEKLKFIDLLDMV